MSHLDLRGLEQQVAECRVAGRGQHCVLDVGEFEAQGAELVQLGLAAGAFGLQEIPEGGGRSQGEEEEPEGGSTELLPISYQALWMWSLLRILTGTRVSPRNTSWARFSLFQRSTLHQKKR